MPRPRYRRRVDLNKLNPFDAHDMDTINREWRRMQARKLRQGNRAHRRAERRGWLRVALVVLTYLALGVGVIACIAIIMTAMLALFA